MNNATKNNTRVLGATAVGAVAGIYLHLQKEKTPEQN